MCHFHGVAQKSGACLISQEAHLGVVYLYWLEALLPQVYPRPQAIQYLVVYRVGVATLTSKVYLPSIVTQ